MKIKVIYVINGSTHNDFLEAPDFLCNISPGKIGMILSRENDGKIIGCKMYGQCEKIDYLEL